MRLWDYCAICGKRIEVGEPCIGVENNSELIGGSICLDCAKIENFPGGKEPVSITDLLARAEEAEAANRQLDGTVTTLMESNKKLADALREAEARCDRLNEARERANEACAKWEGRCRMAEQERDTYKIFFDDVSSKPDCNTCCREQCEYKPKISQTTRFNCPLWRGQKEG